MSGWAGLLRKEFRQQRWSMIGWIAIEVVILFAIFNLSNRMESDWKVLLIMFFAFVLMAQSLLFAAYLFASLIKEGKRMNMWLHNPHSGYSLLFIKIIQVMIFMLISMAIGYIGFVYPFHDVLGHFDVHIARADFARYGLTLFFWLASASVSFGIWLMFFWVLYRVLLTRIGKWAMVVSIALFLVGQSALDFLGKTVLFSWLTEWGEVKIWPSSGEFMVDSENIEIDVDSMEMLFIGEYIFSFVILLILFFLSGWLIDKKVEV